MKKFPKIFVALMVLALVIGMLSALPVAAAGSFKEVRLTGAQLQVGHYTNTDLTGTFVLNSANPDIAKETKNLVDNKSNPFFWSIPYKFNDLKGYGGNLVPAVLIDVANGGEPATISGYNMNLREYLDCMPLHFEIQATTAANSENWVKVFEDSNTYDKWDGDEYHCEFEEVTVYKVRILFYDIGEADTAKDAGHYTTLTGEQTRFSLSEIDLLTELNASTAPTQAATQAPTEATRPAFTMPVTPTAAPTQAPTAAPTEAPTAAPTEAPTAAPTQAPTAAPTEAPTAAPTEAPTQMETVAATEPTAAPTEPATEETTPVDATTPTEAVTEPTGVITTVPATEPATEVNPPAVDNGEGEQKDYTTIIIIVAVVVAAIAGGVAFYFIRKKRGN